MTQLPKTSCSISMPEVAAIYNPRTKVEDYQYEVGKIYDAVSD